MVVRTLKLDALTKPLGVIVVIGCCSWHSRRNQSGTAAAYRQQERPVAVVCGSGYRSSVSSSLLASRGYKNIANVLGGMSAWKRAGLPTTEK